MRYFIDTEFDGHNGPLLSLAIVREDGISLHVRTTERASDPWVVANVEPLMDKHDADVSHDALYIFHLGDVIRTFIAEDSAPVIIADSAVDIGRFCVALTTNAKGEWASVDYPRMTFEVHNVDCYPTALPNAVQHNAWWDAMALGEKLA